MTLSEPVLGPLLTVLCPSSKTAAAHSCIVNNYCDQRIQAGGSACAHRNRKAKAKVHCSNYLVQLSVMGSFAKAAK